MKFNDEFEDISSSSPGSDPLDLMSSSQPADDIGMPSSVDEQQSNTHAVSIYSDDRNVTKEPPEDILFADTVLYEDDANMATNKNGKDRSLNSYSNSRAKRKAKTKLIALNIVISTVLVLSILCTFAMGVVAYYTGGGTYQKITDNKSDLGITQEVIETLPEGIVNIALFGLDSRSKSVENRTTPLSGLADTIIILSVDADNGTVKMVSILRDSWVDVNGTMRKINSAYSKGGAELAIKAINQNFGMNITDYVSVSLHQLWKVIDLVCEAEGSKIKIHITEAERIQLNYLANSEGFGVNKLEESGYVELDGGQAMTYARIRKIDSDGVRALRQQKILNCLFEKAKAIPMTKYPALLKEVMKNVETSLSYDEIFKFAPLLSGGSLTLESTTIPGDEVVATGKIFPDTGGAWVWKYDLDEAKAYIYKYLYGIE